MKTKPTVLFVCNEGGHFSQMLALNSLFGKYNSILVTDNDRANSKIKELSELSGIEKILYQSERRKQLKNRKHQNRLMYLVAHIKTFIKSIMIWNKYRPRYIISTGSNLAFPFFLYGKLRGSKLIYIESRAKVYTKNMSGKLCSPLSDMVIVQWPEMLKVYPEAHYFGTLM